MQSTGWTFRAQSAVATGTTSLTITKPSGTVDNDIMLMWLTHKGASYATVPAGWTPVQQNISGSTRGELLWKRASGEGANYSITGLADTACGMIASYIGGLLSGDIVNVSASVARAAGVYGSTPITPTIKNTLIVSSIHQGANVVVGGQGTDTSLGGNQNTFANFGEWDEQLSTMRTLTDTGTNNGTDCRLTVADGGKPIPDITGVIGVNQPFNNESVWITAALLCDTTQPSAGTRFYISAGPLFKRINEIPAGDWDSDADGPNFGDNGSATYQLVTNKLEGFHLATGSWVTNRQGNYDELYARLVSKPLAAQTIGGTIDLVTMISVRWLSTLGLTALTSARYKLHVYITEGQTGIVRHVLLDNFVDSIDINNTSTVIWTGLSGAQALTSGAALDGDTLVVELGFRIVSSPTPVPTYPPTEYSRITMLNAIGCTLAGNNTSNCVGAIDAVPASTTTSRAPWIDFSQTIDFAPDADPPPNISFETATEIPSNLPYQLVGYDVSASPKNARTVWFKWTAPQSGNVGIYTNGSNYQMIPLELQGTPGSFVAQDDLFQYGSAVQRGLSCSSFDVTQGETYYIVFYLRNFTNATAGELWITMTYLDETPDEGDLYIPNREIYAYRDGVPINWSPLNFLPSGCVIDYSQLPLLDIDDDTIHTDYRIVINSFGGSILTEILDLATLDRNSAEVDFIFDSWRFAGDGENAAALAMDRENALVITHQWGDGFLDVNDLGTTGSIAAFFDSVSDNNEAAAVYRTSIQNGDNTAQPTPPAAEMFQGLAVDSTVPWYGAVSDDNGSILYYVSAGFYIAPRDPAPSYTIKAYNLATDTQLPDVATVTCTGTFANTGPHGLCVHQDGSIFVCTGSTVQRFSSSGTLLNTYTAVGDFGYDGQQLWDVHITPDGQSIIAIDGETMTVFEWNIDSEEQVDMFQTWLSQGNFTQFAIFQPSPLPPPGCPGERAGSVTDGLPYDPFVPTDCGGGEGHDGNRGGPPIGA